MNTRIGLLKAVPVQGPTGQITGKDWVQFAKPWAEPKAVSGRQYMAADAKQSEITMQFKIRYRRDAVSGIRVTHNGELYEVVAPLPDGELRYMMLMCKTAVT